MDKKVSIITGTNRLAELKECIRNVQEQGYSNIEHCIAYEGPNDQEIENYLQYYHSYNGTIKSVRLGRHWSRFLAKSISAVPYQVAQWLASGDYLMWLADDERIDLDHVSSLVRLLEEKDVDFVYSRCNIWFNHETTGRTGMAQVGTDPPRYGQITNALYRAELLDYCGFEPHVGSGTDIFQVTNWMKAGASWAMLDRPTITHRVDKLGEGPDYITLRQPLRGHTKIVDKGIVNEIREQYEPDR